MYRLVKMVWFAFIVNVLAASPIVIGGIRYSLLRMNGLNLQTSQISAKCYFSSPNVTIREGSFVNNFCKFFSSDDGAITIGTNCFIAMNVTFITVTHMIGGSGKRAGTDRYLSINVGNGCWIGANVTVLPGVTIGEGCVIGAGAVVINDCEPNGMYLGVPAKRIKDLV